MSFFEKAKQTASQGLASITTPEGKSDMREAASQVGAQMREAAGHARRGIVTVIEKVDPDTLADLIIKATAIQEKANRALRRKGSAYRIDELSITATIPPQIGFSIARIGDIDDDEPADQPLLDSSELESAVASADGEVLSLEGEIGPTEGSE